MGLIARALALLIFFYLLNLSTTPPIHHFASANGEVSREGNDNNNVLVSVKKGGGGGRGVGFGLGRSKGRGGRGAGGSNVPYQGVIIAGGVASGRHHHHHNSADHNRNRIGLCTGFFSVFLGFFLVLIQDG